MLLSNGSLSGTHQSVMHQVGTCSDLMIMSAEHLADTAGQPVSPPVQQQAADTVTCKAHTVLEKAQ